jgi:hypothetical protein
VAENGSKIFLFYSFETKINFFSFS